MRTVSPLRYPGGKSQLYEFVKHTIRINKLSNVVYCEPFCGGAGLAISLLLNNDVDQIIINDYDPAIYSFWNAIVYETDKFIEKIEYTDVNIDEWIKQREIYKNFKINDFCGYSFEYGFSTFFLNRTNRSGIITGGPIGGIKQESDYKIDCRFNKRNLVSKILEIADRKNSISLYDMDAIDLINNILINSDKERLFIYFDPPYYKQGKKLYYNSFNEHQHKALSNSIKGLDDFFWIATYDNIEYIKKLYSDREILSYNLKYSANRYRKEEEIFFHSNRTNVESFDKVVFI